MCVLLVCCNELLTLVVGRKQKENKGRHTLKTIVKICSLKPRAEPMRFGSEDIPKDSTARVGSTETKMYWRMDDKRVALTAGLKQSCWK
jgi:hypothetical protein